MIYARTVEKYAFLNDKVKALKAQLNELAETVRKEVGPGESAVGFAHVLKVGEKPAVHDKVDYRECLVGAIGIRNVLMLEAEAADRIIGHGTPAVHVSDNPDKDERALVETKKLHREFAELFLP